MNPQYQKILNEIITLYGDNNDIRRNAIGLYKQLKKLHAVNSTKYHRRT